jgi:cytidylate kinase
VSYRVICISRDLGAGGEQLGRSVAERLGFGYVDEEIVAAAAERSGVDVESLQEIEQRQTLVRRLMTAIAESPPATPEAWAMAPDLMAGPGMSEQSREVIREAVREAADEGDVVIVAHAASHVLGDRSDVLRVLVTGSEQRRTARLAEEAGIDAGKAASAVREAERARADYLRRFHDVKQELPTHYDLVVNTDRLDVEDGAGIVVSAAS